MKKILLLLIIFCLMISSAFAIEEPLEEITPDLTLQEEGETQSRTHLYLEKIVAPKIIKFENNFFNELQYGVSYKGFMNFDASNSSLSSRYTFLFEPFVSTKFGENKNEICVAFIPTTNTDNMDRKFWGIFSDFYYKRDISKNHSIKIGNSRTPTGYEGGLSAYAIPFVNRTQIATKYGNAWAPGIRFTGDFGFLEYDMGGFSSTRNLQKLTEGAEFTGWFNFKPFYKKEKSPIKDWKFGIGTNTGHREKTYSVGFFGSQWKNDKWYVSLEYAIANGSNGSVGEMFNKSQGGNFTLGYNLTEKLQVLGRYDVFDPDRNKRKDLINQYGVALNYFVIQNRLMFTLDYIYEQNGPNTPNRNLVHFLTQIKI